jgi:hypothetical protein
VWIVFLAAALASGIANGSVERALWPFPPMGFAILSVVLFFVSSAGVFLVRHALAHGDWTALLMDRVWGQGTYATVVVRLRPTALTIVTCCTLGIVGLASTYLQSRASTSYLHSALALSFGLGLLVAYSLSRKYPPELH